MSIKVNGQNCKVYKGDHKPVNLYRGNKKIAGWKEETQAGEGPLIFEHTYDDEMAVSIEGKTVQESDYRAKDGLSEQVVTEQGINFLDLTKNPLEEGRLLWADGRNYDGYGGTRVHGFIPVKPATIYILSHECAVWLFDENEVFIALPVGRNNSYYNTAFTTTSATKYIRVGFSESGYGVDLTLLAQLQLGTSRTVFESFVPDSPSPDYPSPIESDLPAGTYKHTTAEGKVYEFTLDEELRGIDTEVDKVVFDSFSERGYLEKKVGEWVLLATDISLPSNNDGYTEIAYAQFLKPTGYEGIKNLERVDYIYTHGNPQSDRSNWDTADKIGKILCGATYVRLWVGLPHGITMERARESLAGSILVYKLATPTRSPLTFTEVTSSTSVEVPMEFLTSEPSPDYPSEVKNVEDAIIKVKMVEEIQQTIIDLPILRKIGDVADSYNPVTGEYAQRVQSLACHEVNWFMYTTQISGFVRVYSGFSFANLGIAEGLCTYFKFAKSAYYASVDCIGNTRYAVYATISNERIGVTDETTDADKLLAFKQFLTDQNTIGTPVIFYYQLEIPITTYIEPVTVPTFLGTTVIEQDGEIKGLLTATAKVMEVDR
jgi:hypothetical protein